MNKLSKEALLAEQLEQERLANMVVPKPGLFFWICITFLVGYFGLMILASGGSGYRPEPKQKEEPHIIIKDGKAYYGDTIIND